MTLGANTLAFEVTANVDDLVRNTKRGGDEAERNLKKVEKALEDVEGAAQSTSEEITDALNQKADDLIDELKGIERAAEAVQRELHGLDADPVEVVRDLRRMGASLEDIETDAEQMVRALGRVNDVETQMAQSKFENVGAALKDVDDQTQRARGTMTGFIGGTVGELPLISDAMGPVGEGLGQLAEGALEGELAFKALLGAGLAIGGVTLVMGQINEAFERKREVEEWRTDQVEGYRDALADASTEIGAITEKLIAAEGVSLRTTFFDIDADEMNEVFASAGVTVDQFARLVQGGKGEIEAWADAMSEAGVSTDDITIITNAALEEFKALGDAQDAAAASAAFFARETDESVTALDVQGAAMMRAAYEAERQTGTLDELAESADEVAESVGGVTDSFDGLSDNLSDRRSYLDIQDDLDTMREKAGAALQAASDGAEDAAAKARDYERAQIGVTQKIIDYANEIEGVPAWKKSEIIALVESGEIDAALEALDEMERTRQATVRVTVQQLGNLSLPKGVTVRDRGGPLAAGESAIVAERRPEFVNGELVTSPSLVTGPAQIMSGQQSAAMLAPAAAPTNVFMTFTAPMRPDDIAELQRRADQRNGRL